jgi:hypothetical protein
MGHFFALFLHGARVVDPKLLVFRKVEVVFLADVSGLGPIHCQTKHLPIRNNLAWEKFIGGYFSAGLLIQNPLKIRVVHTVFEVT